MSGCCETTGGGCCGGRKHYTRQERIAHLATYQEDLKRELQGVEERIDELKKSA